MLRKLLKYELSEIMRFLVIFYGLSLLFSILTRLFLGIEDSLVAKIIGEIFRGAAISMMFSILINNTMRLWVLLRQKVYGDESYLLHTLPVEKKTLYASKMITAALTMFLSFLMILLSLAIMLCSGSFLDTMQVWLSAMLGDVALPLWAIIALIVLLLYLEFVNILQCGFAGVILGHKANNKKIFSSVLFGFGAFLAGQMVVLLTMGVLALVNADFMAMFTKNTMPNAGTFVLVVAVCAVVYAGIVAAMWWHNVYQLKKGVDVE